MSAVATLGTRLRGLAEAGRRTIAPCMAQRRAAAPCIACALFRNDPAEIEAAVPGLVSFGSGHAAVRADDGLCLHHGRFVTANATCCDFRRSSVNV